MEDKNQNGSSCSADSYSNNLSEWHLFQTLVQYRKVILLTIAVCLLAAFVYITKAIPIYASSSRLYVEQTGPRLIGEFDGIMTPSKNYLYTQCEVMESMPILSPVVEDPYIRHFKSFDGVDNLLIYLRKKLDVTVGKKDDIISIVFESPYPKEAAKIVNSVVDSYLSYSSQSKQSTVLKVLNILEDEKVKRDKELSDKFAELLAFTKDNGVISFDQNNGGNVAFEKLSSLSTAFANAQLDEITAKADYQATLSVKDEPSKINDFAVATFGSARPVLKNEQDVENELQAELRQAQITLKSLENHVTKEHPAIQTLNSKIAYLQNELNMCQSKSAQMVVDVMKLKWENAAKRKQEIEQAYNVEYAKAKSLGIKATEYSVLQSELARSERICEILDNRIKELNVAEETGGLNISILESARPSLKPAKPEKAKIMIIALIFGAVFGIGLAMILEAVDQKLHSIDQISFSLRVPVLGMVPIIAGQHYGNSQKSLWSRLKKFMVSNFCLDSVGSGNGFSANQTKKYNISENGQQVLTNPDSNVAEAYRTIRTALFFGVHGGRSKVILITSPESGEGKSTLTSNLAVTMAQAGKRVVVLDADLRNPSQNRIFKLEKSRLLTRCLANEIKLDQAIRPGPIDGLDILANSSKSPNPSEMLTSHAFARLIHSLSGIYDHVIIDSAPVLPVSDSQIISTLCDVVVMVVKANQTTVSRCRHARDLLLTAGGTLTGAVINCVSGRDQKYGYYYSHYSSYSYGSDRAKVAVEAG